MYIHFSSSSCAIPLLLQLYSGTVRIILSAAPNMILRFSRLANNDEERACSTARAHHRTGTSTTNNSPCQSLIRHRMRVASRIGPSIIGEPGPSQTGQKQIYSVPWYTHDAMRIMQIYSRTSTKLLDVPKNISLLYLRPSRNLNQLTLFSRKTISLLVITGGILPG
ncbi:hypothetical protein GQ43DRAFT_175165 [Delitschia confertaspora ATCC 74209]|uniref:Uncharacterized protein n=1 Tax=Delitschia confertaspora ATCC 74209 TaxID=1513339 RepID=A0A9P4MPP3_9PLEO|nr:hypothetical protein GQ43DRAFT_175165 [Delitschia confertaspora ATCC 74209]